jgi:hypothetical protein
LELWEITQSLAQYDLQLRFEDYVSKGDSYSGLVTLADYLHFLSEEDGTLRGHLFDWNVRDYQGQVAVNREIQNTLTSTGDDDFWWLNNGITILCSAINIGGDKTFTIENVQIVNGMQTSHNIHAVVSHVGVEQERNRNRSVSVRVIKTQDEGARDRIIRATNSQTVVAPASLHATEDIHRKIEAYFLSRDWYYERRKNYYRNVGKPIDRIIGIPGLGQSVMAMGLGRPNDARARPTTLLNNPTDYEFIFSNDVALETYFLLGTTQRIVDSLLLSEAAAAEAFVRSNLRYYVSTFLITRRLGSRVYDPRQLNAVDQSLFNVTIEDVCDALRATQTHAEIVSRREAWPLDRVAKSKTFADEIIKLASS